MSGRVAQSILPKNSVSLFIFNSHIFSSSQSQELAHAFSICSSFLSSCVLGKFLSRDLIKYSVTFEHSLIYNSKNGTLLVVFREKFIVLKAIRRIFSFSLYFVQISRYLMVLYSCREQPPNIFWEFL